MRRPTSDIVPRDLAADRRGLTLAEIAALPVTVDLITAARAVGIGRTTAHKLARAGQFPCPVLRIAGAYRVPTAGLLKLLGIELTLLAGQATLTAAPDPTGSP